LGVVCSARRFERTTDERGPSGTAANEDVVLMSLVVEHATEIDGADAVAAGRGAGSRVPAVKAELVAGLHARYDAAFGAPAVEAVAVPVVDELLQDARILTFLPLLAERVTRERLRRTP
jgi:hypothetical protein